MPPVKPMLTKPVKDVPEAHSVDGQPWVEAEVGRLRSLLTVLAAVDLAPVPDTYDGERHDLVFDQIGDPVLPTTSAEPVCQFAFERLPTR